MGTILDPVACHFRENPFRERNFSLEIHKIQPSAVFGVRRKHVLRGAGYAWTPDLWSFLKLQEVGFSPYLSFTLILSVFRCFGWFKAVRGRLIGPKTWDRIVGIFLGFSVLAVTAQKFRGLFGCFNSKIFALNHGLIWIGPGMAVDCGFTR